ncbi:hypothetical protein LINPERHAP2_LOCUS33086 [Linum perenne]
MSKTTSRLLPRGRGQSSTTISLSTNGINLFGCLATSLGR